MTPIPISAIFARILDELHTARNSFSEAASWARSDWSDRRGLTDDERHARDAVLETVQQGKDAIDHTKGPIHRVHRNHLPGRGGRS